MGKGKEKRENKSYLLEMFKALVIALIFSLVLILISALIVTFANVDGIAIIIINQVIRGISILFACLLVFKLPKNGWIRGIVFGILYTLITFVVFSLMDEGGFSFGISLLNDIAFGSVTGLISGIISVNFVKRKKIAWFMCSSNV